ncbi:MAG: transcriptional regulator [Alphaproteobacteria bacterium]|nr:transcriptional regulator [Alphaproteobacteria bacterium]
MADGSTEKLPHADLLRMTTEVVAAYVGNNTVSDTQIGDVIRSVYSGLAGLDSPVAEEKPAAQKPAVPPKRSITQDYILCLEDGKKLKMLKRHLRTTYNLTPDEYRAKWGLPADYPMVAPNYAKQRSAFAKKIGLGRRPGGRRGRGRAAGGE